MASTSEEERLKAEIAKLSGAIQTHKEQQNHQPPSYQLYGGGYASRGRGYYPTASTSSRGAYNGARGGYHAPTAPGRGRGRGATSVPPRNRTLILNEAASKPPSQTSAAVSPSGSTDKKDSSLTSNRAAAPAGSTDGWVKRKSTHNMSLVSASTFQRTEPARLAALEATRKAKAQAKAASTSSTAKASRGRPAKASSSVRRGDNMGEVVIDGVVFEFDPSGTKLVKKAVQPSVSVDASASTSVSEAGAGPSTPVTSTVVPLKTSINGQDYIRTKRGNLISAELLAKRKAQREAQAKMGRLDKMVGQISAIQATRNGAVRTKPGARALDAKKARTLCTFFNKTGQCKRGLSCPYLHDSSKIALCPKVLRPSGCTLPKGTCPLSHTPRAERVPHCVHYLRTRKCRNGDECLYTHSDKLHDGMATRICRDFSEYGWCDRGAECEQRHTYECPDFAEKGKCDRKGCKLVHVIRAHDPHDDVASTSSDTVQAQAVQDGDLFVRDDAAAVEPSEGDDDDDEEGGAQRKGKRKRPLMQTELDDDQQVLPDDDYEHEDEDEQEDLDEQVNFAHYPDSRRAKRRKAKAFAQQKDFISFADDDDEEEDPFDSGETAESSQDEDDYHQLETGSVHSEDFELSDLEPDEQHPVHQETEAPQNASPAQDADEDDDDNLVDRGL